MLTLDLRTGIKDMPDKAQAGIAYNAWREFYRNCGFSENHSYFDFPVHPILKSVALEPPKNTKESPHPDIAELVSKLPHAATVTHIAPQRGKKREEGVPPFELVQNGKCEPIEITWDQFKLLQQGKFLVLDSSSGEDPNLHYHYDHYLVNTQAS
jgi:hypothetical protein